MPHLFVPHILSTLSINLQDCQDAPGDPRPCTSSEAEFGTSRSTITLPNSRKQRPQDRMASSNSSCSLGRHALRRRLSVPPLLLGLRLCVASSSSSPSLSPRRPARQRRSHSTTSRAFKILALESSADDTGAACVDSERRILSNVMIKQHDLHGELLHLDPFDLRAPRTDVVPPILRLASSPVSRDPTALCSTCAHEEHGSFTLSRLSSIHSLRKLRPWPPSSRLPYVKHCKKPVWSSRKSTPLLSLKDQGAFLVDEVS